MPDGDTRGRPVDTLVSQPSKDGDTTKAAHQTTTPGTTEAPRVRASEDAVQKTTSATYQTPTTTKTQATATKMSVDDLLMMAITRLEEMEEKMKGMEGPTNA